MCSFRKGYGLKNLKSIKFKMAALRLLLTLIWVILGKLCQIARPLLQNKMCGFRKGSSLKNVQLDLIKKLADL